MTDNREMRKRKGELEPCQSNPQAGWEECVRPRQPAERVEVVQDRSGSIIILIPSAAAPNDTAVI